MLDVCGQQCSHVAEGARLATCRISLRERRRCLFPSSVSLEAKKRSAATASVSQVQHRNSQLKARCRSAAVASGPRLLHSSLEATAKYRSVAGSVVSADSPHHGSKGLVDLGGVTCVPSLHLQTKTKARWN